MSRNVFNPTVSSIECLVLIGNDAGEIRENQDHWLRLHYVCTYAYVFVHTCMCASVCMYMYVWMHLYMFISVCIYSVSMYIWWCACVCVLCMYISICVCLYACVHIYLYVDICMLCTYMCKLRPEKNAHTEVWALLLSGAELQRLREESRHIA